MPSEEYTAGAPHDDPLDDLEPTSLAEQVAPYQDYGDGELAVSLLAYSKINGGPGLAPAPADVGFSYYCPNCEENVRAVTRPDEINLKCPLCGEFPGFLALGEGPR